MDAPQVKQDRGLRGLEVKHMQMRLGDESKPVHDVSTIDTLLALAKDGSRQDNCLDIFFLPPLIKRSGGEEGQKTLLADPKLCQELTEALHLDKSFLTKEASDSNGFMQSQQGWGSEDDETYSFASRFLIKLLKARRMRDVPKYSWYYLSFCVLWLRKNKKKDQPRNGPSCIVVCFDHCSTTIRDSITESFETCSRVKLRESHMATYDVLLQAFFLQYDEALWHFREPVRYLEENRLDIARGIELLRDNDLTSENGVVWSQIEMHELARHAIHTSETLQVAARTVEAALHHFEMHVSPLPQDRTPMTVDILAGLRTSAGRLASLKLRADSFVKRLENEIQLSYNFIGLYQLRNIQSLVRESRDEGKDAATIVTFMTFIFLPPTFVAGFWGMNFVTEKNGKTVVAGDVWKFWVWSILTVVACCGLWGSVHYGKWRPSPKASLTSLWRKVQKSAQARLVV